MAKGKIAPRIIRGERTMAVIFDGMSWPYPLVGLSWRLRYGRSTPEDALAAAGILDAYAQMISDPASKRQKVIANIRHAINRVSSKGDDK